VIILKNSQLNDCKVFFEHIFQLVWKGTTHIGIGVASKGTKSVVVTNYWPKGNIYNIGEGDRAQYFKDNVLPAVPSTLSVPLDENISLI